MNIFAKVSVWGAVITFEEIKTRHVARGIRFGSVKTRFSLPALTPLLLFL